MAFTKTFDSLHSGIGIPVENAYVRLENIRNATKPTIIPGHGHLPGPVVAPVTLSKISLVFGMYASATEKDHADHPRKTFEIHLTDAQAAPFLAAIATGYTLAKANPLGSGATDT